MTEQEAKFVKSIKEKINKYSIKTNLKEVFSKAKNEFLIIQYNDGKEELVDIGIEYFLCSLSASYFIDNYCFLSVPNLGVIPFKLYYFQKEILKELPNYKKYVTLKTRQCGISTVTSFYSLWRALFHESESIAIVSKNKDAAQSFVDKIKITLDKLPYFLNKKLLTENKSNLVFSNNSEIKSEPRSPNAGRSSTLSLLILDEAAFYGSENLAYKIIASAQPTLTRTGGSVIIVSTPNGTSGEGKYYYEQVEQLKLTGNTNTEKLVEIDWYEVPDIEGIYPQKGYNSIIEQFIQKDYFNNSEVKKELKNYFKPIELKWKENEWLKSQHDTLTDAKFRQEILHDFIIMGNSVFSTETMEKVRNKVKEPIMVDKLGNNTIKGLWIWEKPKDKHRYALGVDIAKGSGKDSSSIQVFDVENYEQVAEYIGFVSTPELCRIIKKVANYYNQGYVIIESNGIGEAVFNGVYLDATDPYKNVYKQKLTRNGITVITGWTTTVQTRQLITNLFIDWVNVDELFNEFKIYSSRLQAQMETWVWSNGRPDHIEGGHDDAIMALSFALYNRDKVINSGESFVISEDGKFIDYSISDDLTLKNSKDNNSFDFITSDSEDDDFMKKYNCSEEEYRWLLGK